MLCLVWLHGFDYWFCLDLNGGNESKIVRFSDPQVCSLPLCSETNFHKFKISKSNCKSKSLLYAHTIHIATRFTFTTCPSYRPVWIFLQKIWRKSTIICRFSPNFIYPNRLSMHTKTCGVYAGHNLIKLIQINVILLAGSFFFANYNTNTLHLYNIPSSITTLHINSCRFLKFSSFFSFFFLSAFHSWLRLFSSKEIIFHLNHVDVSRMRYKDVMS